MKVKKACPACNSTDSKPAYQVESFQIVRCKTCCLVYLLNPPSDDAIYEQYYAGEDPDPNNYRSNSPNASLAELWTLNAQRIKVLKRLQPKGTLLDIGCGYGFFLKSAVEAGYFVQGIDISKHAVEFANNSLNVPATVSAIHELLNNGQQYHIVTLWHVLEHFPDPYLALRTVRNLLLEDGICILEVPNLHSLKFVLARNKWSGGNHPLYHRTFFTKPTLQRALEETGFSRIARLQLSYTLSGRSILYESIKKGLNVIACDAFLAYAVWK
jgi:SAM-dependent methyltransferase